ncbi:M23 family metallopeptidase [Thermomonas sp.]|jgi:murein DD-endopeptidase MepM/ murein hydrolase activator NlpD|uniref:M23 family metallopeptidase n=1 Tax=Thermomonas sp. TaxID=1971895 RepID=UPI001B3FF3D6|nr:M23 family metallopeptidase [Thermomonas sp.]MBK6333603.1 peptidoglycan DD-metalloendopeptidase family protein [Thermomonas sp.]MBK6416228.1 peptidoglycan DD-metalloendopeptidase family protein [Thermomonas sp.]MBK6925382.1 peptidoglycan DD-metalloendopeptidase family protein [Thermomonas sp.]MBK7205261.1 peptidoglycan DD-metalloendopeptidase family protein [Thermomonas sp.]MBK9669543.1 peptidoglycan DD-metalloendopeptidase family protein [Thermomonas sp.]
MTETNQQRRNSIHDTRQRLVALAYRLRFHALRRPLAAVGAVLAVGVLLGAGGRSVVGMAEVEALQAADAGRQAELDKVRREAQHEVNALAARLSELQAQANRLNALGARLTRAGQLQDGEFEFDQPVGQGGSGRARDMPPAELRRSIALLEHQFGDADTQLSVLEALLFNRQLDRSALPSRDPIANSYITSGFGGRADPFGGGRQFHKGIDFEADVGDPVLAVADGVVSYSGVRSGYGNVIEIDHGNGYVTRYAHNSALDRSVGDLVRSGQQIARAGSTGRSTGAHVHFEVWQDGAVVNPRKFLGHNDALARHGPDRG